MLYLPRAPLVKLGAATRGKMAVAGKNPKIGPPDPVYRAFLLRCWREAGAGPGEAPAWRYALARAGGVEAPRGFASLEALVAFLRQELAAAGRADKVIVR